MDTDQQEHFVVQMEAIIARSGWMVQGVFPTEDSPDDTPTWLYTIGVEDKGGPELLVVGLPPGVGHQILNDAVEMQLKAGTWWEHGQVLDGLIHTYSMRTVEVTDTVAGDWFNVAWLRRQVRGGAGPLRVLQLVWPEVDGSFVASDRQPILGEVWW